MVWRKEDFYQAIRSAGFDGCEEYAKTLRKEANPTTQERNKRCPNRKTTTKRKI